MFVYVHLYTDMWIHASCGLVAGMHVCVCAFGGQKLT